MWHRGRVILLATVAVALNLEELSPVPLGEPATRLTPLLDGTVVAALGPDSVRLFDSETLEAVASVPRGARAAITRDADGDGTTELWLCAEDGVWRTPWPDPSTLGEPVSVLPEPCLDFAPIPGGLVVADGPLAFWADDGVGGLVDAGAPWAVDLGAEPLLAFDTSQVLAAARGDARIHQFTFDAYTQRVASAGVGGVSLEFGIQVWTVPALDLLEDENGRTAAVAADAGSLARADLDSDGVDEVVIAHPTGLGVVFVSWEGESFFPVDGWVGPILAVRRALCDEVWGLGDGGTTLRRAVATDCLADHDDDGDGWTRGAGDCDDADASTYPDGARQCDGLDHDCDAVIDASQFYSNASAVLEGTQVYFKAPDACASGTGVAVVEDPANAQDAYCGENDGGAFCIVYDQGAVVVSVRLSAGGVTLGEQAVGLTALNVAPRFTDGTLTTLDTTPRTAEEWRFTFHEPGADTVTMVVSGAPPGLVAEDERTLRWTPSADDVGTHLFSIVLSDEDGGRTEVPMTIVVHDPSPAPDEDSGCGGGSAGVLVLGWALRKRRTRGLGSG